MCPGFTQDDIADSRHGNAKKSRQSPVAILPGRVHLANVSDLRIRELCAALALASGLIVAAFAHHIVNVVLLRAKEQVSRVATRVIVAAVANNAAFWDRAIRQEVGVPVGGREIGTRPELTIPVQVDRCSPVPALIWTSNIDFFGEAFWGGTIDRHSSILPLFQCEEVSIG